MKIAENPEVLMKLKPIAIEYARKSFDFVIEPAILDDAFSEGYTGMLSEPVQENFENNKSLLNALIAKTRYHVHREGHKRRNDAMVAPLLPTHTDDHYPEGPSIGRRSLSWFREVPQGFVDSLPERTRTAVALLRDGLSYEQASQVMGVVQINGLLNGIAERYSAWESRDPLPELSEDTMAKLKPQDLSIVLGYRAGVSPDLTARRLGIGGQELTKRWYALRKRFPELAV